MGLTPTYELKLRSSKNPKSSRRIGSAWWNEEFGGYRSIRFDTGVTLSWRDMEDCQLGLFKIQTPGEIKKGKKENPPNDEVPF